VGGFTTEARRHGERRIIYGITIHALLRSRVHCPLDVFADKGTKSENTTCKISLCVAGILTLNLTQFREDSEVTMNPLLIPPTRR